MLPTFSPPAWTATSPSCSQVLQFLLVNLHRHGCGVPAFSCPFMITSLRSSPGQEEVVMGGHESGDLSKEEGVFLVWLLLL